MAWAVVASEGGGAAHGGVLERLVARRALGVLEDAGAALHLLDLRLHASRVLLEPLRLPVVLRHLGLVRLEEALEVVRDDGERELRVVAEQVH